MTAYSLRIIINILKNIAYSKISGTKGIIIIIELPVALNRVKNDSLTSV